VKGELHGPRWLRSARLPSSTSSRRLDTFSFLTTTYPAKMNIPNTKMSNASNHKDVSDSTQLQDTQISARPEDCMPCRVTG
jgi:hypothetical protein